MSEKKEKKAQTPMQKEKRERRTSYQICLDLLKKHFGGTQYFMNHQVEIKSMLETMQTEKKDKSRNYTRLLKNKTPEELQGLLLAIQAQISGK